MKYVKRDLFTSSLARLLLQQQNNSYSSYNYGTAQSASDILDSSRDIQLKNNKHKEDLVYGD